MVWKEYSYDAEKNHPLGKQRPSDDNNFDKNLFAWYKRLAEIRNQRLSLQTGQFRSLLIDNEKNILAFVRYLNNHQFCIVALNRSGISQQLEIPIGNFNLKGRPLENIVTNTRIRTNEEKAIVTLAPVSGVILAPEKD